MLRLLGLAGVLALVGCANGVDVAACKSADWRTVGTQDGASGKSLNAFAVTRDACAKHGVTADFADYKIGHEDGLIHYCRADNGYKIGRHGIAYSGACPSDLEGAFLAAHEDGLGLYRRQAALGEISSQLAKVETQSQRVTASIAETNTTLTGGDLTADQVANLEADLETLAARNAALQAEMRRLEAERQKADKAYRHYEARMASKPVN